MDRPSGSVRSMWRTQIVSPPRLGRSELSKRQQKVEAVVAKLMGGMVMLVKADYEVSVDGTDEYVLRGRIDLISFDVMMIKTTSKVALQP